MLTIESLTLKCMHKVNKFEEELSQLLLERNQINEKIAQLSAVKDENEAFVFRLGEIEK